ncbi:MAG: amidase [Gaiellaceae bacterium]
MTELTWETARSIQERVAAREVTASEVVEHFLSRIDRLDPEVGAFQTVDHDGARATARALDDGLARGEKPGPLCGVPLSVKDLVDVAGLPCTQGSLLFRDTVPAEDAIVVSRLRAAGAVVVGKTVTSEFGMWWQGRTRLGVEAKNPWDTSRTPGGSSSGAGACAAAGLTPLSVGSDGAGSVRMPSAFCGVFGFKPAVARIARSGGTSWPAFGTEGPLTRDVDDAALFMHVAAGPDTRDGASLDAPQPSYLDAEVDPARLRVAWLTTSRNAVETDESLACARGLAEVLVAAGADLEETDLGIDVEEARAVYNAIALATGWTAIRPYYLDPQLRTRLTDYAQLIAEWASRVTVDELAAAVTAQHDYLRVFRAAFERYDVILSPAIGFTALPRTQEIDLDLAWPTTRYLFLANLVNAAAASVPAGFVDGLPLGLQVMAPAEREATVFAVARFLELERPWANTKPELATA